MQISVFIITNVVQLMMLEVIEMRKEIKVEGMLCKHCVAHVKEALEKVNGVTSVEVSLENKNALVEGNAKDEELISAIEEAGYKASL